MVNTQDGEHTRRRVQLMSVLDHGCDARVAVIFAETEERPKGFNDMYQELLDMPASTPEERLASVRGAHRLWRVFQEEAARCVRSVARCRFFFLFFW